jgi:hypothetical protein
VIRWQALIGYITQRHKVVNESRPKTAGTRR